MKIDIFFLSYLAHFFSEREIFKTGVAEKSKLVIYVKTNIHLIFVWPCITDTIKINNQLDATITTY